MTRPLSFDSGLDFLCLLWDDPILHAVEGIGANGREIADGVPMYQHGFLGEAEGSEGRFICKEQPEALCQPGSG